MRPNVQTDLQSPYRTLIEKLREQASTIARLSSGLDEAALSYRVVEGKWSLIELICHLWRVQRVFECRVIQMLESDNPQVEPYDPDQDPEFERLLAIGPARVKEGFAEEREKLMRRLEALDAAAWLRPGRHREYPHYNVHFQIEYMVHHEAHHIYQIFQRRALLGPIPE